MWVKNEYFFRYARPTFRQCLLCDTTLPPVHVPHRGECCLLTVYPSRLQGRNCLTPRNSFSTGATGLRKKGTQPSKGEQGTLSGGKWHLSWILKDNESIQHSEVPGSRKCAKAWGPVTIHQSADPDKNPSQQVKRKPGTKESMPKWHHWYYRVFWVGLKHLFHITSLLTYHLFICLTRWYTNQ